jgi:hypothetical protein
MLGFINDGRDQRFLTKNYTTCRGMWPISQANFHFDFFVLLVLVFLGGITKVDAEEWIGPVLRGPCHFEAAPAPELSDPPPGSTPIPWRMFRFSKKKLYGCSSAIRY